MTPRTILYTGKGGVGQDVGRRRHGAPLRRGGRAHARALDRPRALARRVAGGRGGRRADGGVGRPVGPAGPGPGGDGAQLVGGPGVARRAARRARRRPHRGRGADRPARRSTSCSRCCSSSATTRAASGTSSIVDCAPTGETLRLLSFPDVARWWLDKVFPHERQLLAAARPLARTLLDVSLPERGRVRRRAAAGGQPDRDERDPARPRAHVSIRLVMNPDKMVIGEAMRTFTYLNLYGYLTDAVVVNRVFPDEVEGTYFGAWRELQQRAPGAASSRPSPPSRCCARRTSRARSSARRCSTASAPRCSASGRRRRAARLAVPGAGRRGGAEREPAPRPAVRRARATSR